MMNLKASIWVWHQVWQRTGGPPAQGWYPVITTQALSSFSKEPDVTQAISDPSDARMSKTNSSRVIKLVASRLAPGGDISHKVFSSDFWHKLQLSSD